jgi:hypothetical protein
MKKAVPLVRAPLHDRPARQRAIVELVDLIRLAIRRTEGVAIHAEALDARVELGVERGCGTRCQHDGDGKRGQDETRLGPAAGTAFQAPSSELTASVDV